jgi:CDP-diacylglycerol pyrophosphatase
VSVRRRIATPLILLSATLVPLLAEASDPDALRKIVEGLCVPAETATAHPWPCKLVDLAGRYAVLKDLHGKTQYLVIATDTITGIEAPAVIASNAPNYWEDAWQARRFMDESAGRPAPRNFVGLAINSEKARTQNQLHIHIDCVKADIVKTLGDNGAAVGPTWQRLPALLAGHTYLAMRIEAQDLSGVNPFQLLAEGVPAAKADMGDQTLVVIAATFVDGRDGFYLLNDHVDPASSDWGEGEELLDHSCALLGPGVP